MNICGQVSNMNKLQNGNECKIGIAWGLFQHKCECLFSSHPRLAPPRSKVRCLVMEVMDLGHHYGQVSGKRVCIHRVQSARKFSCISCIKINWSCMRVQWYSCISFTHFSVAYTGKLLCHLLPMEKEGIWIVHLRCHNYLGLVLITPWKQSTRKACSSFWLGLPNQGDLFSS